MKLKRISRRSEKGKLRAILGKLHFEYLKLKRWNLGKCEICGKYTNQLGRFHILRVGTYPKLEFVDFNVLLAGWFCCHYPHHHFGANDPKAKEIEQKIIKLRGEKYRDDLLGLNVIQPKPTMFYLKSLKIFFENEIKNWRE